MSGNGGIDCIMLQSTVISTVKMNENDDCSDPPVTNVAMDNFQLLSLITKGQASTSGPLKSEVAVAVVR